VKINKTMENALGKAIGRLAKLNGVAYEGEGNL